MQSKSPLFLLLLLFTLSTPTTAIGLSCKDHPAYFPGLKSVLLRSWRLLGIKETSFTSNYHPRHSEHIYAPVGDLSSNKWANFDWFWAMKGAVPIERHARLDLQRPVRVFLAVGSKVDKSYPAARLPGWRSEGHAELVKGQGKMLKYGVHQFDYRSVNPKVYIFSKEFGSVAHLPNSLWVEKNIQGIGVQGDVVAMLAESNGKAPPVPRNPSGISQPILPNKRCPDALHDRWVTKNTDNDDADTRGKMWKTWHPAWDPCYWCAYDHEHGSSPYHLMGYAPKYGYTAWKRDREDESNQGFKNFVFRHKDYMVYFGIHVQTSQLRRVYESHHTITLAITKAATKEVMVELTHKGDYGFISTRARAGGFFPLSKEDAVEMQRQAAARTVLRRSVNVINEGNLDPRFAYRTPSAARSLGLYEDWTTKPICTTPGINVSGGPISVDITASATGIKSISQKNVKIPLGITRGSKFFRSTGVERIAKFNNFVISYDSCMFLLENIFGGRAKNGVFYTDAYGVNLVAGPGKNHVKQYIRPGFRLNIVGRYETKDPWLGLHEDGVLGHMVDFGFGLDPNKN